MEDTVAAYCLDRGAYLLGATLEAELQEIEGKNQKDIERKRDRVLRRWFPKVVTTERKFRDPMERFSA